MQYHVVLAGNVRGVQKSPVTVLIALLLRYAAATNAPALYATVNHNAESGISLTVQVTPWSVDTAAVLLLPPLSPMVFSKKRKKVGAGRQMTACPYRMLFYLLCAMTFLR